MIDELFRPVLLKFERLVRRFRADVAGNIALLFGLSMVTMLTAMGAGLDLSRAYLARQKLSEVATLACQYAGRPSIVAASAASSQGFNAAYVAEVDGYINTAWQSQNLNLVQTNATPFNYVTGGAGNVSLVSSVPTTFMEIAGVTTISISVQTHCFDTLNSATQPAPDSSSQLLVQESFESGAGTAYSWATYLPNGLLGTQATPTGYTGAVGYTGDHGTQWRISGYCMEQDKAGTVESAVYDGSFSIELDCDNGSGTAGNSAISTLVYAAAGTYELRYAYASRVDYPAYDPVYLCGSSASDLSWANSTTTSWSGRMATALRTNQINVYFDLDGSNYAPPTHTTMDGAEQLAGGNLIDMCLYGQVWLQRSVMITVTTPGYYWLTFAADGSSDSFGGQLDDIMLCRVSCSGAVRDNFQSVWASPQVLFEDTFESPIYAPDFSNWINKSGNLNLSYGTSGTSSSGWPGQAASGWATAPFNQVNYILQGAAQGNQYVSMDGWNSNGNSLTNRLIGRSFLLDPGYYQVSYKYVSDIDFSAVGGAGIGCATAPASGAIFPSSYAAKTGTIRFFNPIVSDGSTNIVGVFMSSDQTVSSPIGGGALASATSYNNPDGTTSTTPTVAPDKVSWPSYDATALNPVIDVCGYAGSYAWQSRSSIVKITKAGNYLLTFSSNGALADGNGGGIDDVKLTTVGSPYLSSAPSAVTIPVASPLSGSSIYYTGFSIAADRFAP